MSPLPLSFCFVLFSLIPFSLCEVKDYCSLICKNDVVHTACEFAPCKINLNCGKGAKSLPLDEDEQDRILDFHNQRRNQVALGNFSEKGIVMASNMNVLDYDSELAYIAQCWANTCPTIKNTESDQCRITDRFSYVGQNVFELFASYKDFEKDVYDVIKMAVDSWFNDSQYFDEDTIDNYILDEDSNQFTQLIWANTTHVGCGRTIFTHHGHTAILLYCNYGWGGNIPDHSVYSKGNPCLQCKPDKKCTKEYPGLCRTSDNSTYKRMVGRKSMNYTVVSKFSSIKVEDDIVSESIPQLRSDASKKLVKNYLMIFSLLFLTISICYIN